MKKLCIALILVVMLSICPTAFAEEAVFISVEGTYPDGTTGFIYSDDMLCGNSTEISGDLCKVAASLAAAAYTQGSVGNMLGAVGYDCYEFDYSDRNIYDYDRVAYVIAKKIVDGHVFYCVVIRGTSGLEWFSNFNMVDSDAHGGRHPGFDTAANKVIENLDSVFANDGIAASDTTILFTGHSRGAAVANILAAHYNTNNEFAPSDNIYAYTFACPAVTKHPSEDSNIFNFNITGDAVPAVPLAAWNYYRNGIDCPMGTGAGPAFSTRYLSEFGRNNASTPDTVAYEYLIKTLFPTEQAVNEPKGQFFAMLLAWKMAKQPISLNDFLNRFGYNVFSDNELFQEITSKTDLKSIYDLLSDDYAKYSYNDNAVLDYKDFLEEAIDETKNYTEQEFGQWLHDNAETLSEITDLTGEALEEYADLAAALGVVGKIIKYAPTAWDAGTVIGCILDICGNSTDGVNAVLDGHRTGTYVLKINADYYGYCGWENVQGVGKVVIPDNVKTIGYHCFSESDIVKFEGSHALYIGQSAFSGCTSLECVEIGNNSEIGDEAFTSCGSEDNPVDLTFGNETKYGSHIIESSNIGTLSLPSNFAKLVPEDICPFDCTYHGWGNGYTKATIQKLIIRKEDNGAMLDENSNAYRGLASQVNEVEFQEGVTHIGESLFYASNSTLTTPSLQKASLPTTLKSVGDSAFSGQSQLSQIQLPESVTSIGSSAFSIVPITEVKLLSAVIGQSAFSGCTSLECVEIGNNSEIGDEAFTSCGSEDNPVDLTFGNETKYGSHIIESSNIGTLSLPSNFAKLVPEYICPFDCTYHGWGNGYTKATIQKLIIRKEDNGAMLDTKSNAYRGLAAQVNEVEFQEGVTHIGELLFCASNSTLTTPSLLKASLPTTLESVGDSAFDRCSSLHDIFYAGSPDEWSLIIIASGNDTLLTARIHFNPSTLTPDFILPTALLSIENEAFAGGAFIYVKLPENAVAIGWHAFAECPNLAYIYIPALTTQIDEEAFGTMQSLTILGKSGSIAETYAQNHHFTFIAVS